MSADQSPRAGDGKTLAAPFGMALVPTTPTKEMNRAGFHAHQSTGLTGEIWRAMLAAAPVVAPLTLETAEEARKDRAHAEAYYRQAERLLTGNEQTLHAEAERLRGILAQLVNGGAGRQVLDNMRYHGMHTDTDEGRAWAEAARCIPAAKGDRFYRERPLTGCAAGKDGDCTHSQCPQLRDGEPKATGRHCPLDGEIQAPATSEPAAWQERQEVRPGVFGEWYDKPNGWSLTRPREIESGGIRYQFRPLYAAAPAAAPAWQPIETAPPDTQLLLAAEFDRPGDWRIKTGYSDSKTAKWAIWGASWKPTRWMPLPAFPSPATLSGSQP